MHHAIGIRDVEARPALAVRAETTQAGIGRVIGEAVGEISCYLGELGAAAAGAPTVVYHDFGGETVDLEVCVPVAEPVAGRGRIAATELPAGCVAATVHEGPYEGEHEAYEELTVWMEEHGYRPSGPPRETYLVGPAETADPSAFRTEIVWPVR